MPPNVSVVEGVQAEEHEATITKVKEKKEKYFVTDLVWKNITLFVILHSGGLYGFYLAATLNAMVATTAWGLFVAIIGALGVTGGAHRLWTHRCYKATWQAKLILLTLQTIAGQNNMYVWVRDHRLHHKYSDTSADPHNAKRGFFFSHMGWLMMRKLPEVKEKGKTIDMSDIVADRLVMLQKKYYYPLYFALAFGLPVYVPCYFWNETFHNSVFVAYFFRYALGLNGTWFVNSAAHLWGTKPYDKSIMPVENVYPLAFMGLGEGWHNYHHTFPWDYRAAELGIRSSSTTTMIDMFAWLGWAYDRKSVSKEVLQKRVARTGDGSHPVWGWGDQDIPQEDWNDVETLAIIDKKPDVKEIPLTQRKATNRA